MCSMVKYYFTLLSFCKLKAKNDHMQLYFIQKTREALPKHQRRPRILNILLKIIDNHISFI